MLSIALLLAATPQPHVVKAQALAPHSKPHVVKAAVLAAEKPLSFVQPKSDATDGAVKAKGDEAADAVAKSILSQPTKSVNEQSEKAKGDAMADAIAERVIKKLSVHAQDACTAAICAATCFMCQGTDAPCMGGAGTDDLGFTCGDVWNCQASGCGPVCSILTCDGTCQNGKCVPDSPAPSPSGGGGGGCFAKDSTTACLFSSPVAESCSPALMSDLVPGDLVLGREGATTVLAVQHKAIDTIAEMLTFHTASGAVSMTPDHAVFADGELVAAAQVKVGSLLSTGAVKRISKSEAAIINAVTASGTIVADGVLAASNPMWIASLTVDAPITRAVVNAALYAAGDVDTVAAGFGGVLAKIAATAFVAAFAIRSRKASA